MKKPGQFKNGENHTRRPRKRKITGPPVNGMQSIRRGLAGQYQQRLSGLREQLKTGAITKEKYLAQLNVLRQVVRQAQEEYPHSR